MLEYTQAGQMVFPTTPTCTTSILFRSVFWLTIKTELAKLALQYTIPGKRPWALAAQARPKIEGGRLHGGDPRVSVHP